MGVQQKVTALAVVTLLISSSAYAYSFSVSYADCMAQQGAFTLPASTLAAREASLKTDLIANGAGTFIADVLSKLFFRSMPQEQTSGDYCYSHAKRLQLAALNDLSFGAGSKPFARDQATWTAMYDAEIAFLTNLLQQEAQGASTRQSASAEDVKLPSTSEHLFEDIVWDASAERYQCVDSSQNFLHKVCAQEACALCDTSASTNDPNVASGCLGSSKVVQTGLNEPNHWSKRFDWRRRVYLNCLAETLPTYNAVDWKNLGYGDAVSFSANQVGNSCPNVNSWSFSLSPRSCTQMRGA